MTHRADPRIDLVTHEVLNQSVPFEDVDLYASDRVLKEAIAREGNDAVAQHVAPIGLRAGSAQAMAWGHLANVHEPTLHIFDRFGQRIDEVAFHPAYHHLMGLAMESGMHSVAWDTPRPQGGGHTAFAALAYVVGQAEAGIICPMTMTYACIPSMRTEPDVAAEWEPTILQRAYDPRCIPHDQKCSATIGMAMTEKQGGSDVRANTTQARAIPGTDEREYLLTGHKWFCSAPMSDGFLTLAKLPDGGLTCFLVPRWRPDGTRNVFNIQRLKDKLGNRSNASSEIEYRDTWARRIGAPGQGVRTIIEMVRHTRLACMTGSSSLMRAALSQAVHHTRHRSAFGKRLIEQPLMRNVLADLALESEAACALTFRVARAFDEQDGSEDARAFARLATTVGKYWICKRAPQATYEAMECLGGNGYVEQWPMARIFRESPLNSIWEGSGNVMSLDVLRAMGREPETIEAVLTELATTQGDSPELDAAVRALRTELSHTDSLEIRARRVTESMALCLQASLLIRHAPEAVSTAFIRARLTPGRGAGLSFGTLDPDLDIDAILERSAPDVSL